MNFLESLKRHLSILTHGAFQYYNVLHLKELTARGKLEVGRYTYGVNNLLIDDSYNAESVISIGRYCSIAPRVHIINGGNHVTTGLSTYPFRIKFGLEGAFLDGNPYSKGNIIIGHDVWIGTGVTILSGIEIGHGSVIAAGSVITKSVEPFSIVGGNPSRVLMFRFDESIRNRLLKLEWWNCDEMFIKRINPLLSQPLTHELIDILEEKINDQRNSTSI
jgi:acetyltransferase-like isoleucine patch superfamily enzyme